MRLVVLFRNIGPYHHAQMLAAQEKGSIAAIEYGTTTGVAYEGVSPQGLYPHITLESPQGHKSKRRLEDLKSILYELAPSVIVVPGWSDPAAITALEWAISQAVPVIVKSDTQFRDAKRFFLKERLKARIIRLFSAAIVAGRYQVDYILHLGMGRERIFTGLYSVDNNYFAQGAEYARRVPNCRAHLHLPEKFFLASARFIHPKNLIRLLAAYAQYRKIIGKSSWSLVLLGDGQLRRRLERLRIQLDLEEAVLIPGQKSYKELPAYYGLAGAFVHASVIEPWGIVVNEAMAAGLPILVSARCGCASELVEEGRNGWTFDPMDVNALTKLMVHISDENLDRVTMGRVSQSIINRWTPDTFASSLWKAAYFALNSSRPTASMWDLSLLKALICGPL